MTDQSVMDRTQPVATEDLDHEVIVIGAGVAGIYQIKRLVDGGIDATVLEASEDLGGTWWNNRYPGARFDSESYTYGYSWSKELLDEWHWTERFSPQPETLKYLNYVAEKFDLRRHMEFGKRVEAMRWDDDGHFWTIELAGGEARTCRFVFTGLGLLSVPTLPRIEGIEDYQGLAWHPHDWPHEPVDLSDKRVAIIGTGATAIQIIPEVAKEAQHLTVLQRRPNWAAPLNNSPIDDEEMADIRRRYDEIFATCASTPGGFEHAPDRRGFWNVSREERLELWDRLYDGPGFGIWLQNFTEIFMDKDANAEFSDYIAERTRQRIDDPAVAEKLIPTDHGFGIQRVPMETNYFETYNRDNVTLLDVGDEPIQRITETGIETTGGHYDFDVIIYSTGFDAFTGAYDKLDIQGVDGQRLAHKWHDGPMTYYGILVHGFPNFMMIPGPQSAVVNFPRTVETTIDWATPLMEFAREHGHTKFDASEAAEQDWFKEVVLWYERLLIKTSQHWMTGYNSNLDGHEYGKIRYNVYNGGGPKYVRMITDTAEQGYPGIDFA
ncbi:MAG: NAD(P)/FAD-dependent oxidoreductase [Actinomycetota bacterium]